MLPDVVLNTHPSEPTVPPPPKVDPPPESHPAPRKVLVRRAAGRASSRAPSPAVHGDDPRPQEGTSLPSIAEVQGVGEGASMPRKVCISLLLLSIASRSNDRTVEVDTACWYRETDHNWNR